MLEAVAAAHGARFAETLTGFKWIVRAGPGLVYGYEEALGHCVDPDAVRDKDGIATAVLACDLAAGLKAAGQGLLDRLDDLAAAHGVHATVGLSLRLPPADRDAVVARLHAHPPAGWTVARPAPDVLVLRRGGERGADEAREPSILNGGERVVVRPSGTEPKLKAYLQVVEPVTTDVSTARAAADARLTALRAEVAELLEPR
jgi:phosphomannomutase